MDGQDRAALVHEVTVEWGEAVEPQLIKNILENDPAINLRIGLETLRAAEKWGVVVDSHLAALLLQGLADYMVYVKAPLIVRARRIAEREGKSLWEALAETVEREWSQRERFLRYYGVDVWDLSVFHLVVDTSVYRIEEAYRIILEGAKKALARAGPRT